MAQSPAHPDPAPGPSLAGVAASPPRGLPAAPAERPGPPAQPAPASGLSAPCPEPPSPLQLSSAAVGLPVPLHRKDRGKGQAWVETSHGPADSGQVSHAGKIPEEKGRTWYLGWVPLEKLLILWASVFPPAARAHWPCPPHLPTGSGIKEMK